MFEYNFCGRFGSNIHVRALLTDCNVAQQTVGVAQARAGALNRVQSFKTITSQQAVDPNEVCGQNVSI